ncbi:hypothetical protein [Geobacillus subterraneus]|uniref:hypothetical protein n=1 Tax=Geobacillus subterraneus TaxID=129338 RepID=UPI001442D989|nr:hypothetical protein [Geobacillus subterraneus]QIZ67809.1 hypothetical protein HF500_11620 [Geobacillus subterraneus]
MDNKTRESLNNLETKATPGNLAARKQTESKKKQAACAKNMTCEKPETKTRKRFSSNSEPLFASNAPINGECPRLVLPGCPRKAVPSFLPFRLRVIE